MILDPYAARACTDDRCVDKNCWWSRFHIDVVPAESEKLAWAEPRVDEEIRDFMKFL